MEFEYQLKEAEEYGIRKGVRRGRKEGRKEGNVEGHMEEQCLVAQKMIAKGYSDKEILSITDRLTADDLCAMRERS